MERIPNEIFHIIFRLSIFQNPRHNGTASYDGLADFDVSEGKTWPSVFQFQMGPWAISKVCRKWRTIATTFPQLWTHFSLATGDLDPKSDGVATLEAWLSFTGTSALSFLIEPAGICNDSHRARLFELLMDHAHRWEKIEFVNSNSSFWSMLHLNDVRSRLDSLTRVTVHSEEVNIANDALSADPIFYKVFLDATQLRSLINRNHLPVTGLEIPWGQLKEYEGSHRVRVDDHLDMLRNAPNLEECRLEVAYVVSIPNLAQAESSEPGYIVSLPNLHTLQIRTTWFSDSIQDLHRSIRRLRLPALRTLHIISEHLTYISAPFSTFAEVLRSSSSELHTLKLTSRSVSGIEYLRSEDILDLLTATPALRHLCITVGTSGNSRVLQDTIIPRLETASGSRSDVLLPVLEALEFRLPSPAAVPMIDLTALAIAVRSRWTASGSDSIRSLHFVVGVGDSLLDTGVLSYAIRRPIMDVFEDVDIVIETLNELV